MVIDNNSVKLEDLKKALKEAGFEVDRMNFRNPRKENRDGATHDDSGVVLTNLSDDARELKAAFNEARGKVRLLMIVSPG